MTPISSLQNDDSLRTVIAPSLVVTGLTKEAAKALAASDRRLRIDADQRNLEKSQTFLEFPAVRLDLPRNAT